MASTEGVRLSGVKREREPRLASMPRMKETFLLWMALIHHSALPLVLGRLSTWPCLKNLQPLVLLHRHHHHTDPPVRRGPGRSAGRSRASRLSHSGSSCDSPPMPHFWRNWPKTQWIPVDSQKIRADADHTPRPALPHRTTARKDPDILRNGSVSVRFPPQVLDPQQHGRDPVDISPHTPHSRAPSSSSQFSGTPSRRSLNSDLRARS